MSDIGSGDEGISSQSTYPSAGVEGPKRIESAVPSADSGGQAGGRPNRVDRISVLPFQNGEAAVFPAVGESARPGRRRRRVRRAGAVVGQSGLTTYRFFLSATSRQRRAVEVARSPEPAPRARPWPQPEGPEPPRQAPKLGQRPPAPSPHCSAGHRDLRSSCNPGAVLTVIDSCGDKCQCSLFPYVLFSLFSGKPPRVSEYLCSGAIYTSCVMVKVCC